MARLYKFPATKVERLHWVVLVDVLSLKAELRYHIIKIGSLKNFQISHIPRKTQSEVHLYEDVCSRITDRAAEILIDIKILYARGCLILHNFYLFQANKLKKFEKENHSFQVSTRDRADHCHRCHSQLSSRDDFECVYCSGLVCGCGACLCGTSYEDAYSIQPPLPSPDAAILTSAIKNIPGLMKKIEYANDALIFLK